MNAHCVLAFASHYSLDIALKLDLPKSFSSLIFFPFHKNYEIQSCENLTDSSKIDHHKKIQKFKASHDSKKKLEKWEPDFDFRFECITLFFKSSNSKNCMSKKFHSVTDSWHYRGKEILNIKSIVTDRTSCDVYYWKILLDMQWVIIFDKCKKTIEWNFHEIRRKNDYKMTWLKFESGWFDIRKIRVYFHFLILFVLIKNWHDDKKYDSE